MQEIRLHLCGGVVGCAAVHSGGNCDKIAFVFSIRYTTQPGYGMYGCPAILILLCSLQSVGVGEGTNRRGYMQRICVFCGSQVGINGLYRQAATNLGQLLVRHGDVIGVIPESLVARELAHAGLTQLQVVPSMHARKARMADLADAFIALPGGYGTFEELFEVITWAQLGIHRKPIGLLNVAGYFNALKALVDHAIAEGFIPAKYWHLLTMADDASTLLEMLSLKDFRET
jgi:predicted Rossmann-fold nucleotide-binding protein